MRKIILVAALMLSAFGLSAQVTDWNARYTKLVEKVGVSGPGVESVLDKWAQADSSDIRFLEARFMYYYDKSRSDGTASSTNPHYLGQKPLFSLPDTTNHTTVYYYSVDRFDDELFGKALRSIDRAIVVDPYKLDLRICKISALILYEGESPDMAEECILSLIDEDRRKEPKWMFSGEKVDAATFDGMIQEYCANLFTIGSDRSLEAFMNITRKMLSYNKKAPDFMANVGSFYMKKKDYKKALKEYDKVLKIDPQHYSALANCRTIAKILKDPKLIAKYNR
ncbi:MAG: tetratricopeptide repeat protein [Bacteroidales bacterium]|nr:tetratricopeptide repeat protein [Bacteroidales bacterium]